jgi:glucose-1-phosphate thymidylyltransferase
LATTDFIGGDSICVVQGDNIFYGQGLTSKLNEAAAQRSGATLFVHEIHDPRPYPVVELDDNEQVLSINEKSTVPKSKFAVTGLFFFDAAAVDVAGKLRASKAENVAVTDLCRAYLRKKALRAELLGRGTAWLDIGTTDALLEASHFVKVVERRQRLKIACLEEIAWRNGWLDEAQIAAAGELQKQSGYGQYLLSLLSDRHEVAH